MGKCRKHARGFSKAARARRNTAAVGGVVEKRETEQTTRHATTRRGGNKRGQTPAAHARNVKSPDVDCSPSRRGVRIWR
jgi:predicted nucleic acid-binding Zn ribbon protein